jgi:hypothetical protein
MEIFRSDINSWVRSYEPGRDWPQWEKPSVALLIVLNKSARPIIVSSWSHAERSHGQLLLESAAAAAMTWRWSVGGFDKRVVTSIFSMNMHL